MKYWISFGAFQTLEIFSDITLGYILPFYTELKLLIVLWLVMGTKILFDTIVNRELSRREKSIDKWLRKIAKCRNEILAILWIELSQCSLKILSALMTGGMSVLLVKSPHASKHPSRECSEDEDQDEVEDEVPMELEYKIKKEPKYIKHEATAEPLCTENNNITS